MPEYTEKQGQYLAFIYYYTRVNGRPPAETDMQRYFRFLPSPQPPQQRQVRPKERHQ